MICLVLVWLPSGLIMFLRRNGPAGEAGQEKRICVRPRQRAQRKEAERHKV